MKKLMELRNTHPAFSLDGTIEVNANDDKLVITRCVSIANNGNVPVILTKAASLCLDVPQVEWEWVHFHGRHTMERVAERSKLFHGIQESSSKRGTSSHHQNPSVLLCSHDCTETSGSCIGALLAYSDSFKTQTARFKQYRGLIHNGFYFRLSDSLNDKFAMWEYVSEDKKEVLVHGVIFRTEPNRKQYLVKLRGLLPNGNYRLEGSGEVYKGSALMNGGLLLPKSWGDNFPVEMHFISEN